MWGIGDHAPADARGGCEALFRALSCAAPHSCGARRRTGAQILKLWEGLGYYNRVRNLQKGAREVMERFSGVIPRLTATCLPCPAWAATRQARLRRLRSASLCRPWTATSCASPRAYAIIPATCLTRRSNGTWRRRCATSCRDRAGDFNQALMELGAVVCVPNGAPHCGDCPLAGLCRARQLGVRRRCPSRPRKRREK